MHLTYLIILHSIAETTKKPNIYLTKEAAIAITESVPYLTDKSLLKAEKSNPYTFFSAFYEIEKGIEE